MKTLQFLLINLFLRDSDKTLKVIHSLNNPESYKRQDDDEDLIGEHLLSPSTDNIDDYDDEDSDELGDEYIFDKKEDEDSDELGDEYIIDEEIEVNNNQNLIDALNYLKAKKHKTQKDKESIYTLEVLLRNKRS